MKIRVPKFLKKKRNIWIAVVLVALILLGSFVFGGGKGNKTIQMANVSKQNLQQTVLSTGQVVSGIDLSLSFQSSGVVRRVLAKEGDKVKQGQLLANLDQSSAAASLTTAKGALAQAEANYEKLVAGTTLDGINTDASVIVSRKVALDGANKSAINTLNDASLKSYNALAAVTTLQNTYFTGFDQDAKNAKAQMESVLPLLNSSLDKAKTSGLQIDIDNAINVAINSLNTISNALKVVRTTLDQQYYYGLIPDTQKTAIDTQRSAIITTLTSITTDQQAISNAKISLSQSQPEINSAKAQILSARGQVESAQAALNYTVVVAPVAGTITKVDIKPGELATALKEVFVLQDTGNLHIEADVSEANIASLQAGQEIDYTFDALGPDQHFAGKVLAIDPASTVVSGVVNYKIKGSLENVPNIKPGMTVNMAVMVAKKDGALAVPSTAVISKKGKNYVRVIDDEKNKTYHEVEVKTGLQADGGLVEIVSGLSDGQQIITYMK